MPSKHYMVVVINPHLMEWIGEQMREGSPKGQSGDNLDPGLTEWYILVA